MCINGNDFHVQGYIKMASLSEASTPSSSSISPFRLSPLYESSILKRRAQKSRSSSTSTAFSTAETLLPSDTMTSSPDYFAKMAAALAEARNNNLFPPTKAPSTDIQATAHDYELFLQLQAARSALPRTSSSTPCTPTRESQAYNALLIEITRRIQDRDEVYDETASRDEAFRRVEYYIRSVEHEAVCFDTISGGGSVSTRSASGFTSPRSPRSEAPTSPVEVSEEVIDIYEQAAEVAMSEVTTPMMQGIEYWGKMQADQEAMYVQQQQLHDLLQEDQRGLNDGHRALNDGYSTLNQGHSQLNEFHDELNGDYHKLNAENRAHMAELNAQNQEQRALNQEARDLNAATRGLIADLQQLKVSQHGILARLTEQHNSQQLALTALEHHVSVLKAAIGPAANILHHSNNLLQCAAASQNQLAQIVVNLPDAVGQTISQAATQQVAVALAEVTRQRSSSIETQSTIVGSSSSTKSRRSLRTAKLIEKARDMF